MFNVLLLNTCSYSKALNSLVKQWMHSWINKIHHHGWRNHSILYIINNILWVDIINKCYLMDTIHTLHHHHHHHQLITQQQNHLILQVINLFQIFHYRGRHQKKVILAILQCTHHLIVTLKKYHLFPHAPYFER